MPKEKEAYRDNLESVLTFLKEKYGDNRHMLGNKDLREYTGLKYDYVRENFLKKKPYVSAETFARMLS